MHASTSGLRSQQLRLIEAFQREPVFQSILEGSEWGTAIFADCRQQIQDIACKSIHDCGDTLWQHQFGVIERGLAILDSRIRQVQHELNNRRNLLRLTLQFRNPTDIGVQIPLIGPLEVGAASVELHDFFQ